MSESRLKYLINILDIDSIKKIDLDEIDVSILNNVSKSKNMNIIYHFLENYKYPYDKQHIKNIICDCTLKTRLKFIKSMLDNEKCGKYDILETIIDLEDIKLLEEFIKMGEIDEYLVKYIINTSNEQLIYLCEDIICENEDSKNMYIKYIQSNSCLNLEEFDFL